jgi:hypothetical protein
MSWTIFLLSFVNWSDVVLWQAIEPENNKRIGALILDLGPISVVVRRKSIYWLSGGRALNLMVLSTIK